MRNNTKLKKLLQNNTLVLSCNEEGIIECVIKNNNTGNAHVVEGVSITRLLDQALRDTKAVATDDGFNF